MLNDGGFSAPWENDEPLPEIVAHCNTCTYPLNEASAYRDEHEGGAYCRTCWPRHVEAMQAYSGIVDDQEGSTYYSAKAKQLRKP